MRSRSAPTLAAILLAAALLGGCAASRSPIEGAYTGPAAYNANAPKVSVLFLFRHVAQLHGFDAIPKLQVAPVKDFSILFADAQRELSNVSHFETFTELPEDVNEPKRRAELAQKRAAMDYTIEVDFFEESSFAQQCLSGTFTTLSMTVIPMPYYWDYTITAQVTARDGRRIASLQRKATLTAWIEAVLIFAYPFYPLEGRREEIYAGSLHDIFKQIESEKVLK